MMCHLKKIMYFIKIKDSGGILLTGTASRNSKFKETKL